MTVGTTFSIAPNGSCTAADCTATTAGAHTVTGDNAGITDTASLDVVAGAMSSIVVFPGTASIIAGGTQAYSSEGFDQYGNSLGGVTPITVFSIAPNGSCTGGDCTATVAGAHVVTGTLGAFTDDASLTVTGGAYDHGLNITPSSATITAGGSQAYTATGYDQYNNLIDVTATTSFAIYPNGSCSAGVCTATTAGAHTVQGSKAGLAKQASLNVVPAALNRLALSPAVATLGAGGSQTYTAQGRDIYGNSTGDRTATTVFTISPNGSCTGTSCTAAVLGAHTVTGTDGAVSGTASLSVVVGAPATMTITASPAAVKSTGSSTIKVTVKDAAGNLVPNQIVSFRFTQTESGGPIGLPVGGPTVGGGAVTDAAGVAQVTYTAGLLSGTDQVTAKAGAVSAAVSITVSLT